MDEAGTEALDRLVASILQSPRYRHICAAVVRRLGAAELAKRNSWKEAEQETRSRLHQVAGAYLDGRPPYAKWLRILEAADDKNTCEAELRRMMLCHASTRERLPYLERFYARTLAPLGPVASVIDIACGLNTLALPWMNLAPGAGYHGYDLFADMASFAEAAVQTPALSIGCTARVETCDLAAAPPAGAADLALILKFLPLLNHTDAVETARWLGGINTRYALVSFPTRTLSGRNVGMAGSYEARFRAVLQEGRWESERFEFPNELCFLLQLRTG